MNSSPRIHKFTISILIAILIIGGRLPIPVAAQDSGAKQVTVLFLLDDSGSMAANDPTDLRYTAAKLMIASMDEGDVIGAIHFSTQSEAILEGLVTITSSDTKDNIINAFIPKQADGYTDVKAAFTNVEAILTNAPTSGNTIVLFLTDGRPEISQPYDGYENETLAVVKRLGVPVYAIALTFQGQTAFLNQVASLTNGKVISARTANDLLDSYLQILGDLKDRTVIGEGAVRSPEQVTIKLDPALMPYVNKVTFIVSKEATIKANLVGPDGIEVFPSHSMVDFSVVSDPGFAVYTIMNPASGDWKFNLSGSGSAQIRAILHSRLRTRIISPVGLVETDQPLRIVVNLVEEQSDGTIVKVVGDASFSATVILPDGTIQSLDIFYDDGTHGDQIAGDGSFSREFVETSQPGTYRITVQGYKGVIPVTSATRVEAVPFPSIVVDQPIDQKYEIRSNSIPLQIHLDGTDFSGFEGEFIARVVSPSGQRFDIPLIYENGGFSGEMEPDESGAYTIEFQPVNAFYHGLPYQKTAMAKIDAIEIPKIIVKSLKLGLDHATNQGRFELQQAIQGIPLLVTLKSTSAKSEPIIPSVENLPGFSLVETLPITIPPNGETTATLHIAGDPQLTVDEWDGLLILTPQGLVDIVGNRPKIKFETFSPKITISVDVISAASEKSCWRWVPVRLILKTTSTSLQTESLNVQFDGTSGVNLSQKAVEIQPGSGTMGLELETMNKFAPGAYAGSILFTNQRTGVEIFPGLPIPITFRVEPFWVSCKKPLISLGMGILFLAMISAMVIRKARGNTETPIVTGTLVHWNSQTPQLTTMVDLTVLKKNVIYIGRGKENDVVIPDDTVDDVHALITAERIGDEVRYTVQPRSKVRKGYRETLDLLPLEENVTYQMGSRMFTYTPDADL